jgi:FixJ family two-component response regulator
MTLHSRSAVIAVVDDDESVRLAIASLLRSCGWSVSTYASGGEFLEDLDERELSLVIADVQMPEMDGSTLVRKLTEQRSDIPAIFVTAHATPDMAEKTLANGAVGFFTKPLDDVLFLLRVAEIAGHVPH